MLTHSIEKSISVSVPLNSAKKKIKDEKRAKKTDNDNEKIKFVFKSLKWVMETIENKIVRYLMVGLRSKKKWRREGNASL